MKTRGGEDGNQNSGYFCISGLTAHDSIILLVESWWWVRESCFDFVRDVEWPGARQSRPSPNPGALAGAARLLPGGFGLSGDQSCSHHELLCANSQTWFLDSRKTPEQALLSLPPAPPQGFLGARRAWSSARWF